MTKSGERENWFAVSVTVMDRALMDISLSYSNPHIFMSSSKLRLKRTPAEQAEHDLKKARKAARKAAKRKLRHADDDERDDDELKRRRRTDEDVYDDSDSQHGPQSAASSSGSHRAHKVDYDYIQAQVEEERFHEKLWGAMGDDERLDSVEASLNSYAHIPRRWRGGGMERMDDELCTDPLHMEDEDYAEWVRAGMWRCVLSSLFLCLA